MLYWIYKEIESKPERTIEFFNGLAKTEDEAKQVCARKNSILSLIAGKEVNDYKYREVDDSYAESFCFIDKNILNCDFFNASVIFSQNDEPYVSVWDDGIKQINKTEYFEFDDSKYSVTRSYPLGSTKEQIIKQAKALLDNHK